MVFNATFNNISVIPLRLIDCCLMATLAIFHLYRGVRSKGNNSQDALGHVSFKQHVHICRAVFTASYAPGQRSALRPLPKQPLTGIKL